jgi:hypothetical protein
MKTGIKTKIHNRFDIYSTNIETGVTKKVGVAENIVLNQMWARLTARAGYFVNIHFGTGSGTLAATRTTLFTYLDTKAAVNVTLIKAMPVSSWKRKIVLNPEDNVGAVLTEVGISFNAATTSLVTHALIKDSEGNQISITKTAVDIITIYATVYVTFSTNNANLQICGFPNSNPLVNYLIGGVGLAACYFYLGALPMDVLSTQPAVLSILIGASTGATWVADVPNKKMNSSTPRLAIGDSNGHIAEVGFGTSQATPIFRLSLPATDLYSGLSITGATVGTGDATKIIFPLPSNNVKQDTIAIYVDGVLTTDYTKAEIPILVPLFQDTASGGFDPNWGNHIDRRATFSPDGTKLILPATAYTIQGTPSDATNAYKMDEGVFTSLGLTSYGLYCTSGALSADGNIAALCHSVTPFIRTFDLVAGTYVLRASPADLPTGAPRGVALSPNGLILVITYNASPYIITYDWVDSAWVKRADPATPPIGIPTGCALSDDGTILAITHNTSPYISTYAWSGSAWIRRADPIILPTGLANGVSLSSDGAILAIAHAVSPFVTIYDWITGAWEKRADPAVLPAGTSNSASLSGDGSMLVIGSVAAPYLIVYKWINSSWYRLPDITIWPLTSTWATISKNGAVLGYNSLSGTYTCFLTAKTSLLLFNTAPTTGAVITANYTVNGIHKTAQRVVDLSCAITFGEGT